MLSPPPAPSVGGDGAYLRAMRRPPGGRVGVGGGGGAESSVGSTHDGGVSAAGADSCDELNPRADARRVASIRPTKRHAAAPTEASTRSAHPPPLPERAALPKSMAAYTR
jgi:hypothetical protein